MADSLETEPPIAGGSSPDTGSSPPAPALPPIPAYDDPDLDLWERDILYPTRGEFKMEWTPEDRESFADMRWIDDQYWDGAFIDYQGEWIAVVREKLLGHGKDREQLRATVSAATGIPGDRIVTQYIYSEDDFNWKW